MLIKVKDSQIPPRRTNWYIGKHENGVILRLQDAEQDIISCDVLMTAKEAYQLGATLLHESERDENADN